MEGFSAWLNNVRTKFIFEDMKTKRALIVLNNIFNSNTSISEMTNLLQIDHEPQGVEANYDCTIYNNLQ